MKQTPEASARVRRLAWLLDNSIPIPGLNFRIGIEALLGLIPGFGDAAGVVLSSYIVLQAWRMGVPKSVLARMGLNIAVEGVIGAVPVLGDLFDAAWKANMRNVALLEAHAAQPRRTTRASRALLVIFLVVALAIVAGAVVIGWLALRWLAQVAGG